MSLETIGTLPRDQLRHLQLERLQATLNRAYFKVDFYRRRMDELGILPEDVSGFERFRQFPFTTRQDLAAHYPYGLFAVPLRSIVRLKISQAQPSLRGKPVVVGFTRHDIAMWHSLMLRLFEQLGVTDRDVVQVAYNYSLFPGAFTFNHAAEAIGATLAPSATISATLQLQIMQDFHSTVLATTPAFALHIVETLERIEVDRNRLHLRLILLGPDPVSEPLRDRIESGFGAPAYGLYGVSEMVEPGMAGECPARQGLHLAEDQFLAETVHPVTGEPALPGMEGELVVTTLTAEGYPLIRYRTGDITVLHEAPCPCGRLSTRMSPVVRRTDHRVAVRGIPFYPEEVEALLKTLDPAILDFRLLIFTTCGIGDHLDILIARDEGIPFAPEGRSLHLERLRAEVRRMLGFGARVQFVELSRLPQEGLTYKTVFRTLQHG